MPKLPSLAALLLLAVAPASAFDVEGVMGEARLIRAQFSFERPGYVDPDHDPRNRVRPGQMKLPVDECRTADGVLLNRRGATVDEVLTFLERSPVAAPGVREMRRMIRGGERYVLQITDSLRAGIPNGDNVMATYQYSVGSSSQVVYVDLDGELGVLAMHFYHEMTHALDPHTSSFYEEYHRRYPEIQAGIRAVWQGVADRTGKALSETTFGDFRPEEQASLRRANRFLNDNLYRIELRAFQAQMALRADLIGRVACYERYLDQQLSSNELRTKYDDIPGHLHMAYGLYPPEG